MEIMYFSIVIFYKEQLGARRGTRLADWRVGLVKTDTKYEIHKFGDGDVTQGDREMKDCHSN